MNPTTTIAVRAARAAGRVITRYSERLDAIKIESKKRNDFVSEVDRAAEREIISVIRAAFPDHAILAEESGVHKGNDYQWIIDPLDGTTNYLHGFPQYAVSIALRFRGELVNAVVYDPLRDELFHAAKGEGAYLMRDLIVDTAGVRRPGSAALDFAYLAAGRLDGFWELGLAPWDFAAGVLLVKEAGGMVTDISGGERYLESGNVIAGGPHLHHFLVDRVKPHLNDKLAF